MRLTVIIFIHILSVVRAQDYRIGCSRDHFYTLFDSNNVLDYNRVRSVSGQEPSDTNTVIVGKYMFANIEGTLVATFVLDTLVSTVFQAQFTVEKLKQFIDSMNRFYGKRVRDASGQLWWKNKYGERYILRESDKIQYQIELHHFKPKLGTKI